MKVNQEVEHDGIIHFWDGLDFQMHCKSILYSLKRDDEWFPILTEKLIKQNNATNIEELRQRYSEQIKIKNS